MITSIQDAAVLHNGVQLPWLGLGVWQMKENGEVESAIHEAFLAGYRSIDTAAFYENEKGVGIALREGIIPREELFITTKVWNSDQGYEPTLAAFEKSQKKLGLDYIDLYLVHWPVPEKYIETWKAMEKLYDEGLVRAIGVSNFQIGHLKNIMAKSNIKPMVNQIEFHPHFIQDKLRGFCQNNQIQVQAWSPLMQGTVVHDLTICELAMKYNKTPAQIVLRWDIQHNVVTIPKSSTVERIKENAQIFDFTLTTEDMLRLDALDKKEGRIGPDPDIPHTFVF